MRAQIRELVTLNSLINLFLNTKGDLDRAFSNAKGHDCTSGTEVEKLTKDFDNVQNSISYHFAMTQQMRSIGRVPHPFLPNWWNSNTQTKCGILQNDVAHTSISANFQEADDLLKENTQNITKLTNELNKLYSGTQKAIDNVTGQLPLIIGVIALFAVFIMGITYLYQADIQMEWVASGQITQFVTVMILLSTVMALGLTNILHEQVLGTLLGGIAGYVLAQGVGRAASRQTYIAAMGIPPGAQQHHGEGHARAARAQPGLGAATERAEPADEIGDHATR